MDRYTHYTQWNWPEALLAKLDKCYSASLPNSFVLVNNATHNVDRTIVCDFGILALYSQLVVTTTIWERHVFTFVAADMTGAQIPGSSLLGW